ncbi:MAG: CAP domain-containing protein [Candidatus Micrarchaeota archaeon]|nr:CAP domain-containing protein [Candidatus Micrarchaeota archaeon]MDE1846962.1 CAP domain-containing protein [Candidatus Micrarchaeota archaeon]
MPLAQSIISLVLLIMLIGAGYLLLHGKIPQIASIIQGQGGGGYVYTTIPQGSFQTTSEYPQTTINYSGTQAQLVAYALSLINRDRNAYGLGNVTLASEQSGQQHAQDMLANNYFSHWDMLGMKPYMRYTMLGGNGAVAENAATNTSTVQACLGTLCTTKGSIDPQTSLKAMEYSMMYDDVQCCNNGHRENILDPNHNQVSIGIAYNSSTIYFVEDFVDEYIAWAQSTPAISGSEIYLQGAVQGGYNLSSVTVSYDPPVANMSRTQLDATHSYSYGSQVAGVASSHSYYYQGLQTIYADNYQYSQSAGTFDIRFGIRDLITNYSAGEYTVLIWLSKPGQAQSGSFVGATYTVFIDGSGNAFVPAGV